MQQPDFYPHAVAQSIQIIQTHASLVFLTGNYAYKIKKSVDYGFLDYSTLDKRKHFIEEELRLNQKIAPDLYLEVATISEIESELVLGGSRNVVEYALKMRQYPQSNLFSNLLQARKLDEYRLVELGKIVAQFHLSAETRDKPDRQGNSPDRRKTTGDAEASPASLRISSFGTVDTSKSDWQEKLTANS